MRCRARGWRITLASAAGLCAIAAATAFAGASGATGAHAIDAGIVMRTLAWSAVVACGALATGWFPAIVLAGARAGPWRVFIAGVMIAPLFVPPYAHYWAWRLAWPPESWLFRAALEYGATDWLREATLFIALVGWSWPVAALSMAASLSARSGGEDDLLRLDGASWLLRSRAKAFAALPGAAIAAAIVFLFTMNNTTTFDLAQVRTLGYELRAIDAEGGAAADVLLASVPGIVAAAVAAAAALMLVRVRPPQRPPSRTSGAGALATAIAIALGAALIATPWMLLCTRHGISAAMARTVFQHYSQAALNTLGAAGAAGALATLGAIALAICLRAGNVWTRRPALGALGALIVLGAAPGIAVAVAMIALFNREAFAIVYDTPAIVVIALLARFALVAACFGAFLAWREPAEAAALRTLDGARTPRAQWAAGAPQFRAASIASFAAVFTLSIAEVDVVGRVQPPRFETIARLYLDNMHYQRNEMVLLLTLIQSALALAAGMAIALAAGALRRPRVRRAAVFLLMLALPPILLGGCDKSEPRGTLEPILVFGGPGRSPGQFVYPRAIDIDEANERVWVIDRSGRVQCFGLDGRVQGWWLLPSFDNGFPTGVTVAPDGRLSVADTHEHRVAIFDAEGSLLHAFGEFGSGPGQFTFPTDVAFGRDGRIYVSEFGGNDRIQVFDAEFQCLFEFGSFGSEPGQFNRPQSLSFDPSGKELFVADVVNNRIQVFDTEGRLLRTFGDTGTGPAEFRYPYGVLVLDDGNVLVTEFGNSRIQVLTPDGRPVRMLGETGSAEGQLLAPWSTAVAGDRWFILDSRNNRVQVIEAP